jgi:hypothetical protein
MDDDPLAEASFKPLTVSSTGSDPSTPDPMILTAYAAGRARLLLGCYRRDDAADPDTYVAAITAVLARYPEDVICAVTHPASGLPIQKDFLPNVREVYRACEAIQSPRREAKARQRRVQKQIAERAEFEAPKKRRNKSADEQKDPEAPGAPPISTDSEASKAIFALYAVNRMRPLVSNGRVIYPREITGQLLGFAKAPPPAEWLWIDDRQQIAAWSSFLATHITGGRPQLVTTRGLGADAHSGFLAPWPWPPRKDGTISSTGEAA